MKKKYIISAIIAALIFAFTFVYLNFNLVYSLAICLLTYYGVYLIIPNKKIVIIETKNIEDIIDYGYEQVEEIRNVLNKLENETIKTNFRKVCIDIEKILKEIKNNPKKSKQIKNFMSYYLPISIKILKQYDEIENQKLTSIDSKEFMNKVQNMSEKIREATAAQLNSMYNQELINTNADIKVFETMLKSDGLLNNSITVSIEDEKRKEE